MKTILIGGYYGAGNIGDEAILASIISSLTRQRQDLKFVVASFNPEITRQKFQVESVNWREIIELAKYTEQSDLVIVGGGGLFQDYWGVNRQTYLRNIHGGITTYGSLVKLAQVFRKPCMLYAVGVGPLTSTEARQETRDIFEICTVSTVRDRASLRLLEEIGLETNGLTIPVLADPVFCFEPDAGDTVKCAQLIHALHLQTDAPLIGVSLRYWEHGIPFDKWTAMLAGQLDEFVRRTGARLIFTPFQMDAEGKFTNDAAVNRVVVSRMQEREHASVLDEVLSTGVIQSLYGQLDLVIGMRLHAIILSLNAGTPVAAIAYDPKIQTLMDDIGLSQFCSLIASVEDFPGRLNLLWEQRDRVKVEIAEIIPERKRLAEECASIALALLDRAVKDDGGKASTQFVFERLEQMESMDKELKEGKEWIASLQEELQMCDAERLGLKTRIAEIENSRGWKLLETLRKIRRAASDIFKRGA